MPNKSTSQKGSGQSKPGFASMPADKQKEAAKKGGEHSHGGGRTPSKEE